MKAKERTKSNYNPNSKTAPYRLTLMYVCLFLLGFDPADSSWPSCGSLNVWFGGTTVQEQLLLSFWLTWAILFVHPFSTSLYTSSSSRLSQRGEISSLTIRSPKVWSFISPSIDSRWFLRLMMLLVPHVILGFTILKFFFFSGGRGWVNRNWRECLHCKPSFGYILFPSIYTTTHIIDPEVTGIHPIP